MKGKAILGLLVLLLSGLVFSLLPTSVHAITCPSPCSLIVNTNVPSTDASISVTARGNPSPVALNHTYTYGNGTINWVQVTSTNITGTSGARYIFKQWTFNGIQWSTIANSTDLPMMTQNITVTATYDKLLPLTLSFTNLQGQPVSPPTSITLESALGPATLVSGEYSNHWMKAAAWTVASATWQGVQETLGAQTIDLTTTALSATVRVQANDAKMQLVDNSNHPITGATVTVTLVNGTQTYTFTSDSQGYVNLGIVPPGTYNAHVTYQNQDYGSYLVDPSTDPTKTVMLSTGGAGTSAPVVSAFVLLTIFGLALFLIILAIRVRKPPPPPMIG